MVTLKFGVFIAVSDSKPAGGEWGTISYVEQKQCANGNDKTLWCRNQDGEIHTFDIGINYRPNYT